ncbi:MAG TPA: hypothetical protein VMA37_14610 [Acetobacteraceae bacterium]|nr:hypothetical protein [Acetobacteraceae bacterium]
MTTLFPQMGIMQAIEIIEVYERILGPVRHRERYRRVFHDASLVSAGSGTHGLEHRFSCRSIGALDRLSEKRRKCRAENGFPGALDIRRREILLARQLQMGGWDKPLRHV